MEDLFSKFSADQLTDTNYCDVVCVQLTTQMTHCLQTLFYDVQYYFACITANMEAFRWKFIDIFEDVCSLHTRFSADLFHLLCCITPCENSGRFFRATRYNGQPAQKFRGETDGQTDGQTDGHNRFSTFLANAVGNNATFKAHQHSHTVSPTQLECN